MANVVPLRRDPEVLTAFESHLGAKDPKTARTYMTVLRSFAAWLATKPGGAPFRLEAITETAVKGYLDHLADLGRAPNTRSKALTVLRLFCRWCQEEGLLQRRNPAREVTPPQADQMAPKELSEEQRYAIKNLVERIGSAKVGAIFALGYWAGLRVSEVSGLRLVDVDVNQRAGELTVVDGKGGKTRTIDLCNEARRALYRYLKPEDGEQLERDPDSPCVFTSQRAGWLRQQQRADNLSERGIEHLWGKAKEVATRDEWDLVKDIAFHDLRHDFAHRARAAGWSLEEIAVYLGHRKKDGTPAIGTTARYTLPSRQQLRERLQSLRG